MLYGRQFFAWNICGIFLAIGNSKILAIDMCEIFAYWNEEQQSQKLKIEDKKWFLCTSMATVFFKSEANRTDCLILTHAMNSWWWFIESFSAYGTKFSLVMRWLRPTVGYGIFDYTWRYARTRCHNAWDAFLMHDEVAHCKKEASQRKMNSVFLASKLCWLECVHEKKRDNKWRRKKRVVLFIAQQAAKSVHLIGWFKWRKSWTGISNETKKNCHTHVIHCRCHIFSSVHSNFRRIWEVNARQCANNTASLLDVCRVRARYATESRFI